MEVSDAILLGVFGQAVAAEVGGNVADAAPLERDGVPVVLVGSPVEIDLPMEMGGDGPRGWLGLSLDGSGSFEMMVIGMSMAIMIMLIHVLMLIIIMLHVMTVARSFTILYHWLGMTVARVGLAAQRVVAVKMASRVHNLRFMQFIVIVAVILMALIGAESRAFAFRVVASVSNVVDASAVVLDTVSEIASREMLRGSVRVVARSGVVERAFWCAFVVGFETFRVGSGVWVVARVGSAGTLLGRLILLRLVARAGSMLVTAK